MLVMKSTYSHHRDSRVGERQLLTGRCSSDVPEVLEQSEQSFQDHLADSITSLASQNNRGWRDDPSSEQHMPLHS